MATTLGGLTTGQGNIFDQLAQFGRGFDNWFTGDLDYARQLEMLGLNQNFNAEQSALTRSFNASEAQKNRDWQEMMSNSAYQRAVSDLKSAGLNPYLAYNQGGAYTGGGSTASAGAASSNASYSGKSGSGFSAVLSMIGGLAGSAIQAGSRIATQVMRDQTARDIADSKNSIMSDHYGQWYLVNTGRDRYYDAKAANEELTFWNRKHPKG